MTNNHGIKTLTSCFFCAKFHLNAKNKNKKGIFILLQIVWLTFYMFQPSKFIIYEFNILNATNINK